MLDTYYAGIDNGLNGGITFIDSAGKVVFSDRMPVLKGDKNDYDIAAIVDMFTSYRPQSVVLEKAQAFPGQGVSSMFSIGKGFGIMMGILSALKIPFTVVGPKTWQGIILKDLPRENTKQASALYATRTAPDTDWRATEKSRIIHDGKTDSYCMAVYAKKLSTN